MTPKSARKELTPRTPASNDLEDLIPVRIYRMGELFFRLADIEFGGRFDLRVTDLRIINVLHAGEEVSVAEIGRKARVDKAWISRLVRELEARNLVTRRADPDDSRSTLVALSEKGRMLRSKLLPVTRARERFILGSIDRAKFVAELEEIEQRLLILIEKRISDET